MTDLAERLREVVTSDEVAAIAVQESLRPSGGDGEKVMPPIYPEQDGSPYLVEQMWLGGEVTDTVILDQWSSQANRVEEALLEAYDDGRLELPMLDLRVKTSRGEVRITSLDAPHRYADAYWRDSLVDNVRFDKSGLGERLRSASDTDVRPLYEREPLSILLGAWDSHRKGRWPKFARLYQSHMYGVAPLEGARRGTRLDPLNLIGSIDDKEKAEGDWTFVPEGKKGKGTKLSEIGHGNIAPVPAPGGVSVRSIYRVASISLAKVRRVRFGDASADAAALGRAVLVALGLVGDRLAFGGPSLWLRSGCDLVKLDETVAVELIGGEQEPIQVDAASALAAFSTLRDRAAAVGLVMATDVVPMEPTPQLQQAIEFAVASASE